LIDWGKLNFWETPAARKTQKRKAETKHFAAKAVKRKIVAKRDAPKKVPKK